MARVSTSKTINPSQLGVELGRVALRVGDGYVDAPTVDEAALQAGIDAHVADPDWVDPNPPPPSADQLRQADADSGISNLATTAGIRAKCKAVLAGTDTFTAAQRDRALAALVLLAIRDRSDT